MKSSAFYDKLQAAWEKHGLLCLGLDPDIEKIPKAIGRNPEVSAIGAFGHAIIEAVGGSVGIFKPNSAFYEAYGHDGVQYLRLAMRLIRQRNREAVIISDAKRADIGNTNKGYVIAAFDFLEADAITVNPYLGAEDGIQPFLDCPWNGVIILCKTSNKGSAEFQDQLVLVPRDALERLDGGRALSLKCSEEWERIGDRLALPLHQLVALQASCRWNKNSNCGLVVGATFPEQLARVRMLVGNDMPILVPGVGAQGGDLEASLQAGFDDKSAGLIINNSRGILYASSGEDYAEAAKKKAEEMQAKINFIRNANEQRKQIVGAGSARE